MHKHGRRRGTVLTEENCEDENEGEGKPAPVDHSRGAEARRKRKVRRAKMRMPPRNWTASHSAYLPCAIKKDVLSV